MRSTSVRLLAQLPDEVLQQGLQARQQYVPAQHSTAGTLFHRDVTTEQAVQRVTAILQLPEFQGVREILHGPTSIDDSPTDTLLGALAQAHPHTVPIMAAAHQAAVELAKALHEDFRDVIAIGMFTRVLSGEWVRQAALLH